jgi:hypothetical protein
MGFASLYPSYDLRLSQCEIPRTVVRQARTVSVFQPNSLSHPVFVRILAYQAGR